MTRRACLLLTTLLTVITGAPALAHVVSMSTGQATVEGQRVEYLLRMPDYELHGSENPAAALFAHIRFSSGAETGRLLDRECHHDISGAAWICAANYHFSSAVRQLGVECSYQDVTVANHIHVLRAEREGRTDRAILDSTFPAATLTFRPPTAFERAMEQGFAGALRIWTSLPVMGLLLALALASRKWPELITAGALFVTAQFIAAQIAWTAPPRFSESVAALALVYLNVEAILFPTAGGRWLFSAIFGAFSGIYFSAFLRDTGDPAAAVLTGAAFASLSLLAIAGGAGRLLARFRVERWAAGALAAAGCVWFIMRLAG